WRSSRWAAPSPRAATASRPPSTGPTESSLTGESARSRGGENAGAPDRGVTMPIHQHQPTSPSSTNGEDDLAKHLEALARSYGNRFLLEPAPDHKLPEHGMTATDAMRLVGEELVLDGIPMRNLATFVTTWMEPEAQRVIAENLHRNFID